VAFFLSTIFAHLYGHLNGSPIGGPFSFMEFESMKEILLKLAQVREQTRLSKTKVYGLIQQGVFPRPVKQGTNSYWLQSDVDTYIGTLVDQRMAS